MTDGWISTEERLPKNSDHVIVYAQPYPEPEVFVGWYAGGFWYVHGNKCPVSHWMPFPKPPEIK